MLASGWTKYITKIWVLFSVELYISIMIILELM